MHIQVTWCCSRNEQCIPEDRTMHGTTVRKKKMEKKGLKDWQWFFIFSEVNLFFFELKGLCLKAGVKQPFQEATFITPRKTPQRRQHDKYLVSGFQDRVPRNQNKNLSPWSLGPSSSNILSKVYLKTPNLFIGLRH